LAECREPLEVSHTGMGRLLEFPETSLPEILGSCVIIIDGLTTLLIFCANCQKVFSASSIIAEIEQLW
jgi:hypothetical protein